MMELEVAEEFEECEGQLLQLLGEEKAAAESITAASALVERLEGYVGSLVSRPSMPISTQLLLIKKILSICQQGEVASNNLFEALRSQLASLFKATYSLLKNCLDTTFLEQSLGQCDLGTLLTEITAVASLSLYFDPSLLALCWRGVGKVCCSSLATASSTGTMDTGTMDTGTMDTALSHVITELCQAIMTLTGQSTAEQDPLLEKRLKSGRFLCSLMLRLVSRYPAVSEECSKQLVDMLLSTHQTIRTVVKMPLRSKLESSLLLLHEPLIQSMTSSLHFISVLLEPSRSGQHYVWLLCLTILLKHCSSCSDGVLRYCFESVSSREKAFISCRVLDCIFSCLDECHQELSVLCPVAAVVSGDNALSLYEWVCSHLCVTVSRLPMDMFQQVETYLLSRLFVCHSFSALLALDCLSFIARVGGEAFMSIYCKVIMTLLATLQPSPTRAYPVLLLGSLLSRCLALLPSAAQCDLLSSCSYSHVIWSHVQPSSLHHDTVQTLGLQLAPSANSVLVEKHVEERVPALCCLLAVVSSGEVQGEVLSKILLEYTSEDTSHCHELSLYLLCGVLPSLPPASVSEVVWHLSELASFPPWSLSLTLALCCIMGCLSVHPSIQERSMVCLSRSYFSLLCVDHWLVRHHALEAFRTFAEVSPHATTVESCVPSAITSVVIDFLHRIPHRDEVYQARVEYCIPLIHPYHLLTTVKLPAADVGEKVISNLSKSWEIVKSFSKELSVSSLSKLATINASISSYLARHSS